MSRRLLIAALLGVLLFSTPALAGLTIADRQQASTDLARGPQFYEFGSGTDLIVGASTSWAGFTLEGLQVDASSGDLILGRAGDVTPSATEWHDDASSTRACESEPAQSVRAVTFDVQREIDAGRLQAALADIRAFAVSDGAVVPFRTGSPEPTSVVVDTTDFDAPEAVCVYWGNADAASLSNSSISGTVIPDGGWSWRVWENAGDGLSLDLVDWASPSATGAVPTASSPADACNQCANELVGFVTPSVSGSYRFFLSADEVGRLELAPLDDPAALAPIVELTGPTVANDFSDPLQASVAIDLVADQAYAIRARSKDLEDSDHLQIAWALDGEAATVLPTEAISDQAGTPETLTHRRFDLVATADRSGEPVSVSRIEASEKTADTGDNTSNAVSGYVVVPETGTYRFWISTDDEGTLRVAADGNPASASRVAWLTNWTVPDNWTADASQRSSAFELTAGQTIWIEAYNRDRGGPDHLQVGWSRDDAEPATAPDLIPAEHLSENPPVEAPLPSGELGAIEGRQTSNGTFVSSALDTSATGSSVFGLLSRTTGGEVEVEVSFAADATGPWSSPSDLVDQMSAPLDADGLRYVRFSGQLTAADGVSPSVSSLGVEHDLSEASSTDATTTLSVSGGGDEIVLRVRGSIGAPGTAQIAAVSGAASFTFSTASADGLNEVPFGGGQSHHIVVSAVPGSGAATARWSVADSRGALVVHDIVVVTS